MRTDGDGNASVSFTLPDSTTTYRVFVVACDRGAGFASAQRPMLVTKEFYVEPGLPRYRDGELLVAFQYGSFKELGVASTKDLDPFPSAEHVTRRLQAAELADDPGPGTVEAEVVGNGGVETR